MLFTLILASRRCVNKKIKTQIAKPVSPIFVLSPSPAKEHKLEASNFLPSETNGHSKDTHLLHLHHHALSARLDSPLQTHSYG
uniref:Uncharacterized protein n=1 Tax=Ditylenchus dipsaci TaxID=166011 RepID=A0A915E2F0_9BILA